MFFFLLSPPLPSFFLLKFCHGIASGKRGSSLPRSTAESAPVSNDENLE